MEARKILTASFLDILFENRNKEYGAYYLRSTYHRRIAAALIFTALFAGALLAATMLRDPVKPVVASIIGPDTVKITPLKVPPETPPGQPQVRNRQIRTEPYFEPILVPDDQVDPDNQVPTIDEIANAVIGTERIGGDPDSGLVPSRLVEDNRDIITRKPVDEGPVRIVEIQAAFDGDWKKFLTRTLDGNVPVDNGAPPGVYTVLVEFVVDLEGNISNVIALTNHGYGMENEAMRAIRKAPRWRPAMQNGHPVKAYRRQPITFQVQ